MIFCPKCGSILKPDENKKKIVMKCCKCSYFSEEKDAKIVEHIEHKGGIEVVEEKPQIHSKVNEDCPKCKNKEAYYWIIQMRAGDEAATKFFKCTKCEYTWRDNG